MTVRSRAVGATEIPIIDIAGLRDGRSSQSVARQLEWAARELGFIYVKGHGISQSSIETARDTALDFFRLPLTQKQEASSNAFHHGYLRPGQSKMFDDAPIDLKESFNWGFEVDASEPGNRMLAPNRWPPSMPALRAAVHPFFEAASACAVDLLGGFATAAGLSVDAFCATADQPVSRGSLQYYPPPTAEQGERFGVSAHTDFGVLTVLCQDALGGLEIQTADGEWLAVEPIPGTLVVNVGDLLERWSDGYFRSTVHRVINTSGRERLSLVLAYDPNYETLVDPRLLCQPGQVPQHEPITVGDYLVWRFDRAFAYRQR